MTYVKVSKFDFDCMQANSNRYKFLWQYAKSIHVHLPNGQKVLVIPDGENLDQFIDSLLKKQPINEVEHVEL
jgi:hypothetical protein